MAKVVGYEANDGDKNQGMSVGSEKGKIEGDTLAKLSNLG